MTDYEILLMLDPELAEERQAEVVARIKSLAEKGGGTWDGHDAWGRRRLAYEIDHKTDGVYHLIHLTCEPETLDEISRVLKIDDGVMRHLATRRIEGSQIGTPSARARSGRRPGARGCGRDSSPRPQRRRSNQWQQSTASCSSAT